MRQTPLSIVVIEADAHQAALMRDLLSQQGHHVNDASTGLFGIDQIKRARPDVVFCGIGLPGKISGYGVAHLVRQDQKLNNIFLIALARFGSDIDAQKSLNAGFDIHLTRPVDAKHLLEVLTLASRQLSLRDTLR